MTTRDFPTLAERKAARVAFLHVCRELDVKADLCPLAWGRDEFLAHIGKHAVPLE